MSSTATRGHWSRGWLNMNTHVLKLGSGGIDLVSQKNESGLSSRVDTDEGLAGDLQRLWLTHPVCPLAANPLVQFIYLNMPTLISALRLTEV